MTPSRAPGRPRSEEHRLAVLRATKELMLETDLRAVTVDRIAQRSGVTKATVYKRWPNKSAVAIEAFLGSMMTEAPDPDTGSAREDFRQMLRGMMHFYTGPYGRIYAQFVGEAQFDPTIRDRMREVLINQRRGVAKAVWDRGVARGELDPNVDPLVALDLIFAPAVYRMATGHGACIAYAMGAGTAFAMGEVAVATSPETVADLILNVLPEVAPNADDPDYVSWFARQILHPPNLRPCLFQWTNVVEWLDNNTIQRTDGRRGGQVSDQDCRRG